MSDSNKKYPTAVKSIYVAGTGGEGGREIEVNSIESKLKAKISKGYQGWDHELRAQAIAGSKFFSTYLELHEASNEQTKDGSLKHFGKNTIKAQKAALKVLKDKSKAFDYDPSEVHDNIVEYMEELEEEYEEDKA